MDLSEMENQDNQNNYEKLITAINELKMSLTNIEHEVDSIKQTLSSEIPDSDSNYYKDFKIAKKEYRRVKRRVKLHRSKNLSKYRTHAFDGFFEPFSSLSDLNHLGSHISHFVHSALSGVKDGMMELSSFFSDIDFCDKFDDINFDLTRWKEKPPRQRVSAGTNIKVDGSFNFDQPDIDISLDGEYQRNILEKLANKIQTLDSLRQSFESVEESEFLSAVDQLSHKHLIIKEKSGQQRYMITKLGRKALNNPKKLKSDEKSMKSEDNDLGEN